MEVYGNRWAVFCTLSMSFIFSTKKVTQKPKEFLHYSTEFFTKTYQCLYTHSAFFLVWQAKWVSCKRSCNWITQKLAGSTALRFSPKDSSWLFFSSQKRSARMCEGLPLLQDNDYSFVQTEECQAIKQCCHREEKQVCSFSSWPLLLNMAPKSE